LAVDRKLVVGAKIMPSFFSEGFINKSILLERIPWKRTVERGCQMVYLHTQNPYLGTFWRAVEWKMLV
jgi:hypothetical protein